MSMLDRVELHVPDCPRQIADSVQVCVRAWKCRVQRASGHIDICGKPVTMKFQHCFLARGVVRLFCPHHALKFSRYCTCKILMS